MINARQLTKTFKNGKGISDVSFSIAEGEVFGFLGPNGAGKSTTTRHLMGFLKPDKGSAQIHGLDCWIEAPKVQEVVGYLPGEIAFFDDMTGTQFLDFIQSMRQLMNLKRKKDLIERLELDIHTPIRKMSKGMKQKVGIVAAFMHDPAVYLLDEPTSGLDPLMQQRFVELILEEKSRGKTIFMSSHMFQEIEKTCDRVMIIKDGQIVENDQIDTIRKKQRKTFHVSVATDSDLNKILTSSFPTKRLHDRAIEIIVQGNMKEFLQLLHSCDVSDLSMQAESLENIFLGYYGKEQEQ
ncbi:ABC transporter ATP-binding protein [Halalkalibacter urbisdiaboli]|uniref:ABC transporter ATP-binding protein n=1 Tax=Halalkalibacter urbisdiaboli TaxID=1960589 RepID=UPI000B433771|nr:ABC transporter ATP-binding protein [Halalkalibacter urbisdiaboli]